MWRPATKQITGTNDVPLGTRRRFGAAPTEFETAPLQLAPPSPPRQLGRKDIPAKRHREDSPPPGADEPKALKPDDTNPPAKKKKSRWGDHKLDTPGLPTAISATGVSQAQLDNYAIHVRLEEINRKLRLNDVVPPERERSPSPPPTYDSQGRRTNIREVRYRKKLEDERNRLVNRALKNDPNFRPPVEYQQQKRSQRPSDKVYIPVKEFPEINFFGLLVGPRGNSLKKMERESGAKISIRGRGSVKAGKTRPDQYPDDADEDLHCLVLADTEEQVAACVKLINHVIETVRVFLLRFNVLIIPDTLPAASTPEEDNVRKREQLRELALICGTLRDDENQTCQNCGGVGHRKYDCPEQRNFTANVVCRVCGNNGHLARDCHANKDPAMGGGGMTGSPPTGTDRELAGPGFDNEYAKLLAELGESVADSTKAWNGPSASTGVATTGSDVPPWRRPEYWQSYSQPQQNQQQQQQQHLQQHTSTGGAYQPLPGGYYPQQQQQQQQQTPQQWAGYQQQGGQEYGANYGGYYPMAAANQT